MALWLTKSLCPNHLWMRPIVSRLPAGRGQGEPRVGVLQHSQNPTSSVKCAHFVDEETEIQRHAYSKNPLTVLDLRAKYLMVVCDRYVLGKGRPQGSGANCSYSDRRRLIKCHCGVISRICLSMLCDWIVCEGTGGAKSLALFGTAW